MGEASAILGSIALGMALGIAYEQDRPLGYWERRNITIDFACSQGHWRMMKFYCGSIPKDERKPK